MPGDNQLQDLFSIGITRQRFIESYQRMQQDKSNDATIFNDSFKESIGAVFDFLNTTQSSDGSADVLDANEISVFANYDKTDGDNVMSERDLTVLYNKMAEAKQLNNPQTRFDTEVRQRGCDIGQNADLYISSLEDEYSLLQSKIDDRYALSRDKISDYESQINDLISQVNELSDKEKSDYNKKHTELQKAKNEQAKIESELKTKEAELESAEADAQSFVDYAEGTDDEENSESNEQMQNELNGNVSTLRDEYNKLLAKNKSYTKKIASLQKSMKKIEQKAVQKNNELGEKIQELRQKIDAEKSQCNYQVQMYQNQMEVVEQNKDYAIQQIGTLSVGSSEPYSDSDTDSSEWTTDAAALKEKWCKKSKRAQNLSDGFYKKVVAIASRMHCDPNALMGIMNAESGLNPQAVNKNGGATGLIQFMPRTAQGYGTSTSALYNMSAEEQLVYVEKFLTKAKASAGFGANEEMSAGQVYALVFLPARARREVLTTSNEIYYRANSGTDINGDGMITKSELDQRAKKFMA